MATVFERVRKIIIEQLQVDEDEVLPASRLKDDLIADSLDTVEIIQMIEEEFQLTIPDSATDNISTVQDIVDFLETYLEKNPEKAKE